MHALHACMVDIPLTNTKCKSNEAMSKSKKRDKISHQHIPWHTVWYVCVSQALWTLEGRNRDRIEMEIEKKVDLHGPTKVKKWHEWQDWLSDFQNSLMTLTMCTTGGGFENFSILRGGYEKSLRKNFLKKFSEKIFWKNFLKKIGS